MKGKNPYTSPVITAKGVYRIVNGSWMSPSFIIQLLIRPVSRIRKIMANVRTRKLVQNGSTTKKRSKVRQRRLRAITYATGYPSKRQITVHATDQAKVRWSTCRYSGSKNRV